MGDPRPTVIMSGQRITHQLIYGRRAKFRTPLSPTGAKLCGPKIKKMHQGCRGSRLRIGFDGAHPIVNRVFEFELDLLDLSPSFHFSAASSLVQFHHSRERWLGGSFVTELHVHRTMDLL